MAEERRGRLARGFDGATALGGAKSWVRFYGLGIAGPLTASVAVVETAIDGVAAGA